MLTVMQRSIEKLMWKRCGAQHLANFMFSVAFAVHDCQIWPVNVCRKGQCSTQNPLPEVSFWDNGPFVGNGGRSSQTNLMSALNLCLQRTSHYISSSELVCEVW